MLSPQRGRQGAGFAVTPPKGDAKVGDNLLSSKKGKVDLQQKESARHSAGTLLLLLCQLELPKKICQEKIFGKRRRRRKSKEVALLDNFLQNAPRGDVVRRKELESLAFGSVDQRSIQLS